MREKPSKIPISGVSPTPAVDRYAHLPLEFDEIYGCWLWLGAVNGAGHPIKWIDGRAWDVKRYIWGRDVGPIPEAHELDHLCRRILCVNPVHLEPVTRSENEKRKSWRRRSRRELCRKGHDLWLYGRRTPEAGKVCLICSGIKDVES